MGPDGISRSQLLKGALDLCVLALLEAEPAYAGRVVERLGHAGLAAVPEGTLYPALGRLERDGLIGAERVRTPVGPPRKYYSTTARGRERLRALAGEWERLDGAVRALLESLETTKTEVAP